MGDEGVESTPGGSRIYRHQTPESEGFQGAAADTDFRERIEAHIDRYVPGERLVWHEIVSEHVHVDVVLVLPAEGRDYYTLITEGMSDVAMKVPEGFEQYKYAELVVCLPSSWPLSQEAFKNEENYWPIRWLKMLARLPHQFDTWLWVTHTIPAFDPPEPYAANTQMCCALIGVPVLFDEAFWELHIDDETTVHLLSFIPIYREEMEFKLEKGADALFERLEESGVTELLDVNRKNVCA